MSDVKSVTLGPSLAKSEDPTAKISTGTSSFSKRRIFEGLKPPEATILTLSHHSRARSFHFRGNCQLHQAESIAFLTIKTNLGLTPMSSSGAPSGGTDTSRIEELVSRRIA